MNLRTSLAFAFALGSLFVGTARADITNGLVFYLPLEETTGTTVHDQSTNGFIGTLTNTFAGDPQWVTGWITNGLNLNQAQVGGGTTNQLIRFPDAPNLNFTNSATFTVAMWVNFPASQISGAAFIAKGTGGGFEQYDLDWSAVGPGGRYRLVTRQLSAAAVSLSASVAAASNVWQHIAFTCDATNSHAIRCYINGVFNTATTNVNLVNLRGSSHELTIGNRQSASAGYNLPATNVIMDEIRLFNRVLSASDIFELFAFNGSVSHGVAPVITTQPRSVTNYVGDTAPFSIGIAAPAPANQIFYQWYSNSVPIPGATAATLVLSNVQLSFSAAYSVTCSNIVGITNAVAYLQVQPITTTNITTGLVGYWRFDDAAGSTTAADFTGNGNTGTLDSFVDYNACWVAGLTNGALYFNTNGTAIPNVLAIPSVGSPAPPSLDFSSGGAFTLSAFVNGTLPQTNGGAIFCKGTGNGGEQFAVDLNGAAANFRFYVRGINGVLTNPVATTTVPVNGTWQHVAAVCDCVNGIMNIYVNGQLAGAAIAPLTLLSNAHEISIGNRQSGALTTYNLPFTGGIDEARIYNRALSSADIQALYATGGLYPPSFVTQPVGASVYVGEDYRFADTIAGTAPFKYTWKTNGVNANAPNFLAGGTNQTLTITNIQLFNAADYTLSVTNGYGGTNSTVATLSVTNFYITNSLVGWWKFDETTGLTATDSSGNANDGTLTDYVGDDSQWGTGRKQGALNFNYTAPPSPQHYVSVADSPTVNFDTSLKFTLTAWVKGPTAQTNGAAIICKGTGSGGEQYCIDINTGSYRFFCRNAAAASTGGIISGVPPSGQWQHVALAFDGVAGFIRMYINGALVGTNTAPTTLLASSHEVSIGNRQSGAATAYNLPWTGQIDDMRIYSRALSATDIQNLVNDAGILPPVFYAKPVDSIRFVGDNITFSGTADGTGPLTYQWFKNGALISGATNTSLLLTNVQVPDGGSFSLLVTNTVYALGSNSTPAAVLTVTPFDITNYVAYWKLDDTTGSTALDSSTNGNAGTLTGLPVDDSEWVAGRLAGALNFNADGLTGEYVSIPDAAALNFTNQLALTIAAWVRGPASQVSGAAIVAKGTGSGGEQYALDVNGGLYRFFVRNSAGTATSLSSPVAPNGRWQHVVATYDGAAAVMRIFVNGQQVASLVAPTSLLPNTHEVSIGSRQQAAGAYNFQFTGVLDDVRLYARALRTNEVQQIYALATNFGPVIYTQPASSTNYVHDAVTLRVVADGTDPLSYQWQKNGAPISGATSNALPFSDLALNDAAAYTVVVTNPLPGSILSSNAVLTVLALPAPDLTNELIAYWAFDETTGGAAADSSGRGNSATLVEFASDDSEWVPGAINHALYFSTNGSGATANYRVTTDAPLIFDNGNYFSFSFWAKRDGATPAGSPRILTPQVAGQTAVVWVPGVGVGPLTPVARANTEPLVNVWRNFVVTSDRLAGTYSLYVDGVKQVANAGGYVRADPTTAPQYWFIGHSETTATTTDSFPGFLDDVRIYNRILNYNDVQALYFSAAQRLGSGQLAFAPTVSQLASGNTLTLSWSRGAVGFNLYKSDSLSAPAWTTVTNVPVVSADGASLTVTVPINAASRYYRLQNP